MRFYRRCGRALVLFAALTVTQVLAQSSDPAVGSRLGSRTQAGKAGGADEAIRASHKFARCINFARDRTVRRWLTTVDPAEYSRAGVDVFKVVECDYIGFEDPWMASAMVVGTEPMRRGTLAEAALRKDGKLDVKAGPLPALALADGYKRTWFAMTGRPASVDAMAACFADTEPALVFDLLRTTPTEPEERAAVGRVAAKLGACLVGGAKVKLNAFILRTSLAEAYFHRVYGPEAGPGRAS